MPCHRITAVDKGGNQGKHFRRFVVAVVAAVVRWGDDYSCTVGDGCIPS